MCYARVGENLVDAPEIECRSILTIWPRVLDGHSRGAATAAANKPVYGVPVHARHNMNADTKLTKMKRPS